LIQTRYGIAKGISVESPIRRLSIATLSGASRQRKRRQANRCIIIAKPAEFGKQCFRGAVGPGIILQKHTGFWKYVFASISRDWLDCLREMLCDMRAPYKKMTASDQLHPCPL
jgi:hypothetical protein